MQLIKVEGIGITLRVHIEDEERYTSPHTGRELRRQVGQATGDESENAALLEALRGGPVPSVNMDGEKTALWRVRVPQHSTLSNGVGRYRLELVELEELRATRVVLGEGNEIPLVPYAYEEETLAGGVSIKMRVKTSPELTERVFDLLNAGPDYFPVVREGVEDTPRQMRFGQLQWSRDVALGEDKISIPLIEAVVDENDPGVRRGTGGLFNDTRARSEVALEIEFMRGLLDLLEDKGVLTADERRHLNERARQRQPRAYLDLVRVDDIDGA